MLFRKKMPRSCATCQYGTPFSFILFFFLKHGVVADSYACRKFRYDPCKRIPPFAKAPEFEKYADEDFQL